MSNYMTESEKRQTKKALSGKYSYFDASVFTEDNLRKLEHIARRQEKTELMEKLEDEIFRQEQEKVEKADNISRWYELKLDEIR